MTKSEDFSQCPLITLFLFAFNQEKYIWEACQAALTQNYSPLEIIFSDDSSQDQTYEIMKAAADAYTGPHDVKINRNEVNLGLIDHVNKCFEISGGELIVVAAGDDVSLPDRVSRIAQMFISNKDALLIHSNVIEIGLDGARQKIRVPPIIEQRMNLREISTSMSLYIGATAAFSPKLQTEYGPIKFKNAYEDLVFGFRAAMEESVFYIDAPLVLYRTGVGISNFAASNRYSSRISNREKNIRVCFDVMRQRLADVRNSRLHSCDTDMICAMERVEKRYYLILLFYHQARHLFYRIISADLFIIIGVIYSEIRFIINGRAVIRSIVQKIQSQFVSLLKPSNKRAR